METFNKLTAPASEKLRQIQKMVEDIKKHDGSIMNRLKRFQNEQAAFIRKTGKSTWNRMKKKPPPKLPTRDYNADDNVDGEEWSGSEFDSDTYEDPLEDQDDNYEPPPSEQAKRGFAPAPSASFPRGEYIDSLRDRPNQLSRPPVRSPRDPNPSLPPKHAQPEEDSEDYIDPEEAEDDNYIDPSEKPAPNLPSANRGPATGRPRVPSTKSERSHSPDLYEVPDLEDKLPPVSRSSAHLRLPAQRTPPRASPRLHAKKRTPPPEPVEDEDEDEYEVCDPDENESVKSSPLPSLKIPTPRPRALTKPSLPAKPNAVLLQREPEARPLALKHIVQSARPPPSDSTRARSTLPQRTSSPKLPVDRGTMPRDEPTTVEEEAGVYKKVWYASTCDRRCAEEALTRSSKEGAYLVRKSSGQCPGQPYTLVVFYKGRVYNIPVRHIQASGQYALGREKTGEERFSSVSNIIEHHQRKPLVLIDSQNNTKDCTKLLHAVRP